MILQRPITAIFLLLALTVAVVAADDCEDDHPQCLSWSKEGACKSNPEFMLENCKKSCDQCNNAEVEYDSVAQVEGEGVFTKATSAEKEPCVDKNEDCSALAENNECELNAPHMLRICPVSCNVCHFSDAHVSDMVARGYMGVPQLLGPNQAGAIADAIRMAESIFEESSKTADCRNRDANCAYYATRGYCGVTPYMEENCGPMCMSC